MKPATSQERAGFRLERAVGEVEAEIELAAERPYQVDLLIEGLLLMGSLHPGREVLAVGGRLRDERRGIRGLVAAQ